MMAIDLQWLYTVIGFVLAIFILVTFHEFGHFFVARRLGVKVLRFCVGFGRVIWSRKDRKDTEFALAWFPLGGYVQMLDENETADIPVADQPYAFNRQSLWKRVAIVLAGPAFNFLLAFLLFWMVFAIGTYALAPVLGEVRPGSIAAQAGLKPGDEILAVHQQPVSNWNEVALALLTLYPTDNAIDLKIKRPPQNSVLEIALNPKEWQLAAQHPKPLESLGMRFATPQIPLTIVAVQADYPAARAGLQKNDKILAINQQPVKNWREFSRYLKTHRVADYQLLIQRGQQQLVVRVSPKPPSGQQTIPVFGLVFKPLPWSKALLRKTQFPIYLAWLPASQETWRMTQLTFGMLVKLVTGALSTKTLSGPLGIATVAGQSLAAGATAFLQFLALISIGLGVLNLLPIPLLDGGHLLYYLLEGIRGKALSQQAQGLFFRIGVLALLSLMMLAFYNDIHRLLVK